MADLGNGDWKSKEMAEKLAKQAGGAVKNFAKKKLMKIILPILGSVLPFLLVFIVIILLFGGIVSFADKISDFFSQIKSDNPGMTDEEIEAYLDDAENVYDCLHGNSGALLSQDEVYAALNPSEVVIMDRSTITMIFDAIHAYDEERQDTNERILTYEYRKEIYDSDEDIPELDASGNLADEDHGLSEADNAYYGENEKGNELKNVRAATRSEMEVEIGDDGDDIFRVRWQPIYSACYLVATQQYLSWGAESDVDWSIGEISGKDSGTYFLTQAVVDSILDIFILKADYLYDVMDEANGADYDFLGMAKDKSAFKLEIDEYDSHDGEDTIHIRKTRRIPYSAPDTISNAFESYNYNYSANGSDTDRECTSRTYEAYAYKLIAALQPYMSDVVKATSNNGVSYDASFFREVFAASLDMLPDPDGELYDFYITQLLDEYVSGNETFFISNYTDDGGRCPAIGVIYCPKIATTGETIAEDVDIDFNIEEIDVSIPDAQAATIMWVSDLHSIPMDIENSTMAARITGDPCNGYGGYDSDILFENIIAYANAKKPDLVIFGGDIVDQGGKEFYENGIIEGINKLTCDYMFLGADHDYLTDLLGSGVSSYYTSAMAQIGEQTDGVVKYEFEGFNVVGQKKSNDKSNSGIASSYFDEPTILAIHCPYGDEDMKLDAQTTLWRGKVYNWSKMGSEYYLSGSNLTFCENYLWKESNVVQVLAGHVHHSYSIDLNPSCNEHIFAPAFELTIGMVQVNGGKVEEVDYYEDAMEGGRILYGDYNSKHIAPTKDGVYVYGKNDAGLATYIVTSDAEESIAETDNYTLAQWKKILSHYKGSSGKSGVDPMFANDEAIAACAETFYNWERESGNTLSLTAFLGIRKQEGLGSMMPVKGYNFLNYICTSAEKSKGWYIKVVTEENGTYYYMDFKKKYASLGSDSEILQAALEEQLDRIQNSWINNRKRYSLKLFIFNPGYEAGKWSTLSYSFCPPYADSAFPWGNNIGESYAGWVNKAAAYMMEARGYAN